MNTTQTNHAARDAWVDGKLGLLSLEQKIGQLMVFPFYGAVITPDIEDVIREGHVGGLRITQKFHPGVGTHRPDPSGREFQSLASAPPADNTYDRPAELGRITCTPQEYAATLNRLREMAMESNGGVPMHFAFDQEGESPDLFFGARLFPFPMGIRASGDPELAYKVAYNVGRQARTLGGNMIHSPVVDVNTNPANPEIGPRAYGITGEDVCRFSVRAMQGFLDAGIIPTAKHFPGRGESTTDAHFDLPQVELSRTVMDETHLAPYRKLIADGLPAVMAAFTAYAAFDPGRPAAASSKVINGLLRQELGFDGVVTTDNIMMHGLLKKFEVGEAAVECLKAGCDLVLCRSYAPIRKHLIEKVKEVMRSGEYPEAALDSSVARILRMRWQMGIVETGGMVDPEQAGSLFDDPQMKADAEETARRTVTVLRNEDQLFPIAPETRVLLVEQVHEFHNYINNSYSHPGMLWQEMRRLSDKVSVVAVNEKVTASDLAAIEARIPDYDLIVVAGYYNYRMRCSIQETLQRISTFGKPMLMVSNTPYEKFGVPGKYANVLVTFCAAGREHVRTVAEILYGKREATAKLDIPTA